MHRGTPLWNVLDETIHDLVKNGDITETTRMNSIVGHIRKKLQLLLTKTDR
jgi:hypothetical protein